MHSEAVSVASYLTLAKTLVLHITGKVTLSCQLKWS